MKIWTRGFNPQFLAVSLCLALLAGCASDKSDKEEQKKKDKEATTFGMHVEVNADGSKRSAPITLLRASPITINVENTPFLSHADIIKADIVEEMGIWGIRVYFTQPHGARLLEYVTGSFKGQRIAVHAEWGEGRWLAAPQIVTRIEDGVFTFTPDASHEEIERIVKGLNNVAKEVRKREQ